MIAQAGQNAATSAVFAPGSYSSSRASYGVLVVADGRGLLPLQLDRPLQQRLEPREVVRLAGLGPHLLAEHGQLGQLLDERLRQFRFAIVIAAEVDDVGAGVAVRIGRERAVGQLGQPLAHFGRSLRL